jgi:catechol 2,3-dioxygenase-like lactoylglutathione lyase family enzyme
MPADCHHIALLTNNLKRLVHFYVKKLGFRKEKESSAPKRVMGPAFGLYKDCRLAKLRRGRIRLEIISLSSGRFKPRARDRIGYSHWAYGVKNRTKFCKDLQKKKVNIIKIKRNGNFVFFLKDPDGNRIEIQEGQ